VSGDPLFLALLRQASVPAPVPEYRFAPSDPSCSRNELAALGWRLLRTTPSGLHDLATIALIKRTITPLP
jgi:hypothetical protein